MDKKLWLSGLKTTAFRSNTQKGGPGQRGGVRKEGPERRGQKEGPERRGRKGDQKGGRKGNQKGKAIKEGLYRRG